MHCILWLCAPCLLPILTSHNCVSTLVFKKVKSENIMCLDKKWYQLNMLLSLCLIYIPWTSISNLINCFFFNACSICSISKLFVQQSLKYFFINAFVKTNIDFRIIRGCLKVLLAFIMLCCSKNSYARWSYGRSKSGNSSRHFSVTQ